MPAALAVDWQEVRTVAIALGSADQAADQFGISRVATRKRSSRERWLSHQQAARAQLKEPGRAELVTAAHPKGAVTTVTAASVIAQSMEDLSKRGRLAYLRAGVAVGEHAQQLAESDPDAALHAGQNVKAWAGTTALAAGWDDRPSGAKVLVNVSLLGVAVEQIAAQDVPEIESAVIG